MEKTEEKESVIEVKKEETETEKRIQFLMEKFPAILEVGHSCCCIRTETSMNLSVIYMDLGVLILW